MVEFNASAGFSITGNQVDLDISQLDDETVTAMLAEAGQVAAERDLVFPKEAVALVIQTSMAAAEETEGLITSADVTPELLIATVDDSAAWYTKVASELNDGRTKKDRVEIVPEGELAERAEAWLTEERLNAAEEGLDYDAENPLLLLALPNTAVSHQEILDTWDKARGGRLWKWNGQLAFIENWPADKLSGFDPDQASEPVRFVVMETGYDEDRAGTRQEQLKTLKNIQRRHPAVRSASLFEGGLYANRYINQPNPHWRDTYIHQIELDPSGQDAYVGGDGGAYVNRSGVNCDYVSRRLVG